MTSDIGGPSSSSGKWDPNSQLSDQGGDEGEERGRATPPRGKLQSTGLEQPLQGPAGGYDKENARPVSPPRSSSSDGRRASPAKGGAPLLRRMVYSPPPALRPALFSPLWAAPSGSPTSSDDLLNPMSTAAALDSWWIGGGVAALRPGGEGKRATAQNASGSEGGDATSETGEERWDGESDGGEGSGGKSAAAGTSNRSSSASGDQEAQEESTVRESGRQGTDESVATSRAGVAADGGHRTTAEREEQGLAQRSEGMVRGMIDDLIDVVAEDSQPMAVGAAGSGGGGGNGGRSAESHEDTWGAQAGGVQSSAGGRGASQRADAALSAVLPGEGKGMEVGEEALTSSLSSTPAPQPTAAVPDTATTRAPSSNTTSSQRSSRNRAAAASSASTRRSEASGYDVSVTAMEPEPKDGMCNVGWVGLLSCGPGGHGRPYVDYRITIRRRGGGEGKENEMSTVRRYSELLHFHHMWCEQGLVPRDIEHPFPPKPSPFSAVHQPNSERVVPSCAFVQQRRGELQAYLSDLLIHAPTDLWQDPLFRSMFE